MTPPPAGPGPRGSTDEAPPSHGCPYCDETFARADHRILHIGRAHPVLMTPKERVGFEGACTDEEAWFRRLRKHVRSGLAALPVFMFYVLTVTLLYQANGNPAFAVMLFPGFVAFSALVYGMTFSYLSLREAKDDEETG